ncbi:MAG TPA: DUF2971 domain-containing protein [Thermoanaerobaculia bacterium]
MEDSNPRPSIDIDVLNRFLVQVGSYREDLIFFKGDLAEIYHYTDLAGLQGIVENHDLWLTHSQYCNDEEELTHGQRVVDEILSEELAKPNDPNREAYLKLLAGIFKKPSPEGVYICCFCEKGNLLSQWRGYSANGTGVAIGLDPQGFGYITGPDSPSCGLVRLWRVFYEESQQRNIVRQAVEFAFIDPLLQAKPVEERAQRAADAIQFFIPTFKNKDFEDEKEIRLIFTPYPQSVPQPKPVRPKFRVARGFLIPYYSLKELSQNPQTPPRLPITGVCVGPSVNKRSNVESARMLLAKAGYPDNVTSSDTPYRG